MLNSKQTEAATRSGTAWNQSQSDGGRWLEKVLDGVVFYLQLVWQRREIEQLGIGGNGVGGFCTAAYCVSDLYALIKRLSFVSIVKMKGDSLTDRNKSNKLCNIYTEILTLSAIFFSPSLRRYVSKHLTFGTLFLKAPSLLFSALLLLLYSKGKRELGIFEILLYRDLFFYYKEFGNNLQEVFIRFF